MCREYKLACLNWFCHLLPVNGKLYLVHWWKMFIVSALSNMGHKIKHLAIQKLNHLTSGACWCTVLLEGAKVKLSSQVCESDHFGLFCGYSGKLQQLVIDEADKARHRHRAAVQQTKMHLYCKICISFISFQPFCCHSRHFFLLSCDYCICICP